MLPRSEGFSHSFKIAAASKRSDRVYKPGPAWGAKADLSSNPVSYGDEIQQQSMFHQTGFGK